MAKVPEMKFAVDEQETTVNYCPNCGVLANEEVEDGTCCQCHAETTQKSKAQWILKMTKYGERLADDLSKTDYLDYIKGKVYVNVYIQNEDTDTDKGELLSVFLKRGDFNTKAYFTNRYGDDIPTYVTYTPDDKAKVIKSILLHYLYTKYADKLKADK